LESELGQLKTDFETENKEKQKLLKAKAKLEQDVNTANAKNQSDSMLIAQHESKIKRLEEELAESKEKIRSIT